MAATKTKTKTKTKTPARSWLLTQNRELRKDGVYAWTLPALAARLPDGRLIKTCPQAGICAALCYARNGTFNFPAVKAAHVAKLAMVVNDLAGWEQRMCDELTHKRYSGRAIRIHDSGDFFSRAYAESWLRIARAHRDKTFYTYTKEVELFQELRRKRRIPRNFRVAFSLGGKQDGLIAPTRDRHVEVFPTRAALDAAGYRDQGDNDMLAYRLPTRRVGIVANNVPHLKKRQGAHTFGELQRNPRLLVQPHTAKTAKVPAKRAKVAKQRHTSDEHATLGSARAARAARAATAPTAVTTTPPLTPPLQASLFDTGTYLVWLKQMEQGNNHA